MNLYWSIFKNLESEVLNLAQLIHFDEEQLTVYSVRIADLLIRCAVEIEAISKDLYVKNEGQSNLSDKNGHTRDMYFDTDCLNFLEEKWKLSTKEVIVANTNMYFSNDENKVLTPLRNANKRSDRGSDWKRAYQAVKHDRGNSLKKANIKNLIRSLAALYLLNIYYKEHEPILLGKIQKLPDTSFGSHIFSLKAAACIFKFPNLKINLNNEMLKATHIIKPTDESCLAYHSEAKEAFRKQVDILVSAGYKEKQQEEISYPEVLELTLHFGGPELLAKVSAIDPSTSKFLTRLNYEAVLNKSSAIKIQEPGS